MQLRKTWTDEGTMDGMGFDRNAFRLNGKAARFVGAASGTGCAMAGIAIPGKRP